MKQPSAIAYLFGNPFLFFILGIMTLIVGIIAFTTQGFAMPAIVILGVMGYATNCSRQVLAYKKWQREWDRMSGQSPKPPFRMNLRWLRYPAIIGLWLLVAGWIASNSDAAAGPVIAIFWLGSFAAAGALVAKAIRGVSRAVPQTQETDAVVVCVNVPLRSVPVEATYPVLPEYCKKLMVRSK